MKTLPIIRHLIYFVQSARLVFIWSITGDENPLEFDNLESIWKGEEE